MPRKRKRCVMPFPTFCGQFRRSPGCPGEGRVERRDRSAAIHGGSGIRFTPETGLLLQLALQRFDLFGQRDILADQGLDLAHGVQHRGVVAAPEAAADFGQ